MPARLRRRTAAAVRLGLWASRLSRALGRDGAVIGGRVALAADPGSLALLAADRPVALVTGTNGKTTTTAFLAAALRSLGPVATNATGANMPDGLLGALIDEPQARFAALEVDEGYLARASEAVRPSVVVLLNLSRDQLDRVGEVRKIEALIRAGLERAPASVLVANADDPMVVSAAGDARRTVWVSAGQSWVHDAAACPRCAAGIEREGRSWWCRCGLRRPEPHWTVNESGVTGPDGVAFPLRLRLPGRMNRANAAMAIAAAAALGVSPASAARAVGSVREVAGRYRTVRVGGRSARLLLAKNPAGWAETLRLLEKHDRGLVIAVDGQESDGRDLSWLWDVPFEQLRGRDVVVTGGRAADLAVRLAYADVHCSQVDDMLAAVGASASTDVDLVATYSCFHRLSRDLDAN